MAHLFRVILPVADINAAASFYAGVLGSDGQRVSPGRHCFDCEGTILACYDPLADLARYTQAQLNRIAREFNTRPRKTLGYRTPADILAATVASTG